jgi:hypothetical protein
MRQAESARAKTPALGAMATQTVPRQIKMAALRTDLALIPLNPKRRDQSVLVISWRSPYPLRFVFYSFCRVHQTLRVTPAMEAGIADHVWEIEEIAALLDSKS